MPRPHRVIATRHGELLLGERCLIMGILNVTPDSFSDGGRYLDHATAVAHAMAMQADGADLIDIGGESTRPGSTGVSEDEQIRRVVPVIRQVRDQGLMCPISIDTRSARVAEAAIEAGADMINDVSAGRHDRGILRVAVETQAPFIVMHMLGTPETMQQNPVYGDVAAEVRAFFEERAAALASAGIDVSKRMLVDPGIGFGKTPEHNLTLVRESGRAFSDWPVVIGASRKRFIGRMLHDAGLTPRMPPDERELMIGTAAIVAHCALNGIAVARVHDVREMRAVVEVCRRIRGDSGEPSA